MRRQIGRGATVSVVPCGTYDQEDVDRSVREAVRLAGGIGSFIRPGDRVLIKPNLLKARPPEDAVTTHPEVLRAVIGLVREAGGTAMVGDSPGLGDLRRVAEKAGMLPVLEEAGVPLVPFDDAVTVRSTGRFQRFEIARPLAEVDAVINLPKLKTHGMTVLTGAVKNLFGCIPGKRKVQWHFNTGVDHESFMRMLVELAALIRPRLTVMDAIVGMEGNGPGSGDPRKIGAVIAGIDPVAVDVVAGELVGVSAEKLPVIKAARAAGYGAGRMNEINLAGTPLETLRLNDFVLPPREHTEWSVPEWMRRSLKDALTTRPVIDSGACVRCGICEGHCPQQAISPAHGKLTIDYRRCIRCFCCQEFCPQGAISVGKGWALKLFRK